MGFARNAWSRTPWALQGDLTNIVPPGWQETPGGSYAYSTQPGVGAWALRSWGGMVGVPVYASGGIAVSADPSLGVVSIRTWWPNATALQLVRITPDGVRHPVRGGYPVVPTVPTRTNLCTNPSLETATTGWLAGNAQTTITRTTAPAYVASGSYTLRLTSTSTTTGALVPGTLTGPSGRAYTIGFSLAVSTRPTAITITVPWLDAVGANAGTSTVNLSADEINRSVGTGARYAVTVVAPAGAATGSVRLTVDGIVANTTTVDTDAWTIEVGVTDGSYFDGTSQGGSWTGTAHLSTSLLAAVLTVVDGEAPFDTSLRYEVYNPAITGGRAAAQPVVLASTGLTWLTHPDTPGAPFVVQLSAPTPARTYELDQGVFYAVGRSRPIVVSAAQRHAATGTLTFGATTRAELRALLATLADASPVLLRMPADYDPGDMWVALGGLTVDPQGRLPYQDTRLVVAPFTEVDPPDSALVA